jgi:hypothetical protein
VKKKQVLRKQKHSMTDLTTVTILPTTPARPEVSTPQYKSFVGRILVLVTYSNNHPPKSNVARAGEPPPSVLVHRDGSYDKAEYEAFCKHRDVKPRPHPLVIGHDENVYNHYSACCTSVGVEPSPSEHWNDVLRAKHWLFTKSDAEWHLLVPKPHDKLGFGKKLVSDVLGTKKHSVHRPLRQTFSRCLQCNNQFDALQSTEFCNEECRRAWLEEHQPAYLTRPTDRPITLFEYIARAVYCPDLQKVNKRDMTPWEKRSDINVKTIVNRKVNDPEKTIPYSKTRWCAKCVEHVDELKHTCQQQHAAHLEHWFYYKTATGLHAARRLAPDWSSNKARREQERLQRKRLSGDLIYRLLFALPSELVLNLKHSVAEEIALKAFLVGSFSRLTPSLQSYAFNLSNLRHLHCAGSSVVDRVTVRDLSTINVALPSRAYGVDYLALVNPLTCKHPQARTFTFTSGEVIKMCPDCSVPFTFTAETLRKYDEARKVLLTSGKTERPTFPSLRFYNLRLNELARSLSAQCNAEYLAGGYQLCHDCGNLMSNGDGVTHRCDNHYFHPTCEPLKNPLDLSENAYAIPKGWLRSGASLDQQRFVRGEGKRVNTEGRFDDGDQFDHESLKWGGEGRYSDDDLGDRCSRDIRAKKWFAEQQRHTPKTKSMCLQCGADIYSRKGVNFCPDTSCAQRFQDEWPRLKEDLLRAAQHDPLIMDLYLAINKNRKVNK